MSQDEKLFWSSRRYLGIRDNTNAPREDELIRWVIIEGYKRYQGGYLVYQVVDEVKRRLGILTRP